MRLLFANSFGRSIFAPETGCNFTHIFSIAQEEKIQSMIKNIIFDLGGVILNIDFTRSVEAFRKLGIDDIAEIYTGYSQSKFFDLYDKGLISDNDFINELKKNIPSNVSKHQIIDAWNAMILDFPADRIELLQKLKKKYRLFLLSNTNSIHFPVYNNQLKEIYEISDLSELFENTYYSFRIGMRKPDVDFFKLVLNENNLKAEETLFVDDSPLNTEAAEKLGINALEYNPEESLEKVLLRLNINSF